MSIFKIYAWDFRLHRNQNLLQKLHDPDALKQIIILMGLMYIYGVSVSLAIDKQESKLYEFEF